MLPFMQFLILVFSVSCVHTIVTCKTVFDVFIGLF